MCSGKHPTHSKHICPSKHGSFNLIMPLQNLLNVHCHLGNILHILFVICLHTHMDILYICSVSGCLQSTRHRDRCVGIGSIHFMCTINTMDLVSILPKGLKFHSHIIFLCTIYMRTTPHIFSITCFSMHPLISYTLLPKLFPLRMRLTFDRTRAAYLSCTTNTMTIGNTS